MCWLITPAQSLLGQSWLCFFLFCFLDLELQERCRPRLSPVYIGPFHFLLSPVFHSWFREIFPHIEDTLDESPDCYRTNTKTQNKPPHAQSCRRTVYRLLPLISAHAFALLQKTGATGQKPQKHRAIMQTWSETVKSYSKNNSIAPIDL